jgi:cyclopropane fatty-acyl-phospholipid synthase-like methyltransferase
MPKEPTYDTGFFDDGRQYFAHGLPAWKDFVLTDLQASSLADFGCGQGDWLEPLQGTIPVWGCDYGADEAHLRIDKASFQRVDFSRMGSGDLTVGKRDVVMSLEVMEHVEHVHETNFLDCLLSPDPRLVVFGVASGRGTYDPTQFKENRLGEQVPGGPLWKHQWGRHHVNCQPVDVVVAKMAARGYVVDPALSQRFSTLTVPGKTGRPKLAFASFYRKNTRVYRKALA